jgi:23S rRNA pseudouridine1911/1915/1917 synthase
MSEEMPEVAEGETLQVPATAKGERLDKWVTEQIPTLTRSQVTKWIEEGRVWVNGEVPQKAGIKLAGDETIVLDLPQPPSEIPLAENIPLEVIYEDDDVLVINKAAGLVVHPAPGHQGGTVVNALLARYPTFSDPEQPDRPGIVHRLDRDTSGVLIIAKNPNARRFLQRQFHKRTTEKLYVALVLGQPKTARGTIEGPIGRHATHRQKRAVLAEGRPAITHYETIEEFEGFTFLRIRPVTGRTHQIRVHLEAIGLPVAGDEMYGSKRKKIKGLNRHFLHAEQLTIPLPNGETQTFVAPLPYDLEQVLTTLQKTMI